LIDICNFLLGLFQGNHKNRSINLLDVYLIMTYMAMGMVQLFLIQNLLVLYSFWLLHKFPGAQLELWFKLTHLVLLGVTNCRFFWC